MTDPTSEGHLSEWRQSAHLAEDMIPRVGRLYRDRGVIITIFGHSLVNKTPIEIIQLHEKAQENFQVEISLADTHPVLEAISELDLSPARIDIGNLFAQLLGQGRDVNVAEGVALALAQICTGRASIRPKPQDVVLYGFGRIGRLVARILVGKTGRGDALRLRAIVVRKGGGKGDLEKRASLLRRDSVHGHFAGTITVDEEGKALIVNGNRILVIYSDGPDEIDYTEYGIHDALIVDNTGKWRTREELSLHVKAPGAAKVILTAPGKGDITNFVYGVNHQGLRSAGAVLSAASCTTNAIVPVVKTVHDEFGIVAGHMESCHSFTNDQNLIDNYHKKDRRGRAATLNMVVTETGAAKAVAAALPELAGRLTGNAVRVPTPNVSLAILNLHLSRATDVEELNGCLRAASLEGDLQNQIDYVNSREVVSSDFVGNRYARGRSGDHRERRVLRSLCLVRQRVRL